MLQLPERRSSMTSNVVATSHDDNLPPAIRPFYVWGNYSTGDQSLSFFKNLLGKLFDRPSVAADPIQIPDAFIQQAKILDEIGPEVIACTPENWTNAVFVIKCDGRRIDYSLKNHRGEEGMASLTPELAQLAEKLYTLMASSGNRWTTAELQYDQVSDGWDFKSQFTYD